MATLQIEQLIGREDAKRRPGRFLLFVAAPLVATESFSSGRGTSSICFGSVFRLSDRENTTVFFFFSYVKKNTKGIHGSIYEGVLPAFKLRCFGSYGWLTFSDGWWMVGINRQPKWAIYQMPWGPIPKSPNQNFSGKRSLCRSFGQRFFPISQFFGFLANLMIFISNFLNL